MASSTCLLISASKISSEFTTHPPVSTMENSRPFQSTLPYWRSRVVPAVGSTIAVLDWVRRLKRVDLPTLGRPTIATSWLIGGYGCWVLLFNVSELAQLAFAVPPVWFYFYEHLEIYVLAEESLDVLACLGAHMFQA